MFRGCLPFADNRRVSESKVNAEKGTCMRNKRFGGKLKKENNVKMIKYESFQNKDENDYSFNDLSITFYVLIF